MAKAKLGSGKRFKALTSTLAAKGAKNPKALAAFIGRKKFGKKKFQKLASNGKKHIMLHQKLARGMKIK